LTFEIDEVTLYRSGVGFFIGKCKETEFILPVNEEDVNDILKSLSVDGLKTVTFSTAEKKEDIYRKLGIAIDSQMALLSVSKHLIGLEVEIAAEKILTGKVLGIDYLITESQGEESEIEVLVIQNEQKINHIPLNAIKQIKLKNQAVQKDLQAYLDIEATSRKDGVTSLLVLTEKKDAVMQWVIPISAWRLSYRVQYELDSKKAKFIGIAIVDNTTSIDWEKVNLRLVTGRPVSFRYDLHSPLIVNRPWMAREEMGSSPLLAQHSFTRSRSERPKTIVGKGYDKGGHYAPGAIPSSRSEKTIERADWGITRDIISIDSQIASQEIGSSVCYLVNKPITISRSESSLIPLFTKEMKGELFVVLREDRLDDPMDALIFKKDIEFEKGVATIYLDNNFAGDAMIVRGTDYIAFRVNQDLKAIKTTTSKEKITKVSIKNKIMYQENTEVLEHNFKFLNLTEETMKVLLEITKKENYTPEEKPTKETKNYYRYELELKPGTTTKTFDFKRIYSTSIYVRNLSEKNVKELMDQDLLKAKDEKTITAIFTLLRDISEKEKESKEIQQEIDYEYRNQKRLRENIRMLQEINQSDKGQEYINRLKSSEKLLEQLQKEHEKLQQMIAKMKKEI
jgi:hypothetical protein